MASSIIEAFPTRPGHQAALIAKDPINDPAGEARPRRKRWSCELEEDLFQAPLIWMQFSSE